MSLNNSKVKIESQIIREGQEQEAFMLDVLREPEHWNHRKRRWHLSTGRKTKRLDEAISYLSGHLISLNYDQALLTRQVFEP